MAVLARPGDWRAEALTCSTIFAVSSGAPPAAIAIVRISGPRAGNALDALTRSRRPSPRQAAIRRLTDPVSGTLLDVALVLWFPGPATATGEDLAELHVHGGKAVISALEATLTKTAGLQPAAPGEFTRRAFENGRIDLSQAEGLADLLAAETEGQRRAALATAEGGLRQMVEAWQRDLIGMMAHIEALVDFADEDEVDGDSGLMESVAALAKSVRQALTLAPAERLRDGVRVGIAGPPNAGKSTLLNALAGRDAAIVSDIAGTTRDVIEVPVLLGGVPLVLLDTAGLRDDSEDAVEKIGIDRARAVAVSSDILLWLGPPNACPAHSHPIKVGAKSDLASRAIVGLDLLVSAQTGDGMDSLVQAIVALASGLLPKAGALTLTAYQRAALVSASDALVQAGTQADLVLCAEEMRTALHAFDRVTGKANIEAVLDALFGRFCIGK